MSRQKNSYANPAFCQQSEFYHRSPPRDPRQSPIGAQNVQRIDESEKYEEQEFYEEVILDGNGTVQDKKFVVVHNESKFSPQRPKNRYEYIPMREQEIKVSPKKTIQYHEEIEASTGRVHRYAVIENEEHEEEVIEMQSKAKSGRYALVPVEEVSNKGRYALVSDLAVKNRYEYIDDEEEKPKIKQIYYEDSRQFSPKQPVYPSRLVQAQTQQMQIQPQMQQAQIQSQQMYQGYPRMLSPQPQRRPPNAATQKLHELLTTPRKNQKPPKQHQSPISPIHYSTPNRTKSTPRAQQKLNYTLSTRQGGTPDKRHTAIVAPICSSPVQSVYSETTLSNKTASWSNLKVKKPPVLSLAAAMMVLCGGVTTGLCFYMISFMGRLYYLDFSVVAGFTCLIFGLLGFRSRHVYWLPNRNYISGYFMLSVFSLLTCAGLLVLLVMRPRPGTPLADMTSGAVCGISGLSLMLAALGVIASYCCRVPPPDNRVQHCAPGFTV